MVFGILIYNRREIDKFISMRFEMHYIAQLHYSSSSALHTHISTSICRGYLNSTTINHVLELSTSQTICAG